MNNINVILVKIEDDRVVVLNGEKYLVVDKLALEEINELVPTRIYTRTEALQSAILEILKAHPNIASSEIRKHLTEKYEFPEFTGNTMRSLLSRMKDKGLIRVHGSRNTATWSIMRRLSDDK